jgi:hypothetical protein
LVKVVLVMQGTPETLEAEKVLAGVGVGAVATEV